MKTEVHHHKGARGEFYIEMEGRKVGELTYNTPSEKHMVIDSTYVDPSQREHGHGHELVDAAANYARKNNIKVETTCSFVRRLFQENSEYDDIKLFR